jgi:hypothetical protein
MLYSLPPCIGNRQFKSLIYSKKEGIVYHFLTKEKMCSFFYKTKGLAAYSFYNKKLSSLFLKNCHVSFPPTTGSFGGLKLPLHLVLFSPTFCIAAPLIEPLLAPLA